MICVHPSREWNNKRPTGCQEVFGWERDGGGGGKRKNHHMERPIRVEYSGKKTNAFSFSVMHFAAYSLQNKQRTVPLVPFSKGPRFQLEGYLQD